MSLRETHALIVGAGGLGCPAARVLVRAGVGRLTLLDDERVDESNLHRQTLYEPSDVGRAKTEAARARLLQEAAARGRTCEVVAREIRVTPEHAVQLVGGHDVVLDGTDNFASKFLLADACALAGVPLVQAGAVRWVGWVMGALPGRSACLRCVFEDVPRGREDTCAASGVVGPVVGVIAAQQALIALRLLRGEAAAAGVLYSYDGLAGAFRGRSVSRQPRCPLCSGIIKDTELARYATPEHAA